MGGLSGTLNGTEPPLMPLIRAVVCVFCASIRLLAVAKFSSERIFHLRNLQFAATTLALHAEPEEGLRCISRP